MNSTDAGRVAEAMVLARLAENGWYPFIDMSGKCPVDILAWRGGEIVSIQVKSTSVQTPSGKWQVQIGSVRTNKNSNRVVKFNNTMQDYLAVYVAELNTVTFVRSSSINAGRALAVEAVNNIID